MGATVTGVTVRLTGAVPPSGRSQIARQVNATDGLVPVVKGNGYGFGRVLVGRLAAEFCDTVAVGTSTSSHGLPDRLTTVVLTPTLHAPDDAA